MPACSKGLLQQVLEPDNVPHMVLLQDGNFDGHHRGALVTDCQLYLEFTIVSTGTLF